ncbi:MAG: hypothetical protein LBI34_01970 [Puniceicoccales bacterium]|jgi:RNA polymerase-binding transcription factor DksA|nr:hypothetical protein [Puniceicoccales bacterium]
MKGKNEKKVADCKPFTIDDIRQLLEDRAKCVNVAACSTSPTKEVRHHKPTTPLKPITTINSVGTKEKKSASVLDILGFNPCEQQPAPTIYNRDDVSQKWKKHFDQLIEMRNQLEERVSFLAKDALGQGVIGDGSGCLSMPGKYTADGAARQVDLELALTFVATEQDLLKEVDAALVRIMDGTYGVCQLTGQAIEAKRLAVLPFARFALKGQEEHERARQAQSRKQRQTPIFTDGDEKTDLIHDEDVEEE